MKACERGAAVGSADLDDLGDAGIGMIFDELPGDEAAGAMADEDDVLVAELAQLRDIVSELAMLDDGIDGSILAIGENEDVGGFGQFLDERAIGTLPGPQRSLGNILVLE